jgi:hypothetical protein
LLGLRFCDLKLTIANTPLEGRIERLYAELKARGLRFRPHCWLAEEWFSPDGVPGIAIPFYLAHRRLMQLEHRQMLGVEGGTDRWCMQLLRHEAGHALDTAYGLHRRRRWKELFGRFDKPYPKHYAPRPRSRNYVLHLDWWYAQSHPAEDFAETFAVWLPLGDRWKRDYAGWGALRKLCYLDELMTSLRGRRPRNHKRDQIESLRHNQRTLGEHYAEKRRFYDTEVPEVYEAELRRLFAPPGEPAGPKRSAAAFLRRQASVLRENCARGTGEHPYVIDQILQEMVVRCRELKLYVAGPEEVTRMNVAIFIVVHTLNYLRRARYRVPV